MRYSSKEFLSPSPYESGSIITLVETPLVKDIDEHMLENDPRMTAKITMRACYGEPIELDFDVYGESGFEKRLAKIDKLQAEIEKFKSHFVSGWRNHLRNYEHAKEQKEKEMVDEQMDSRS